MQITYHIQTNHIKFQARKVYVTLKWVLDIWDAKTINKILKIYFWALFQEDTLQKLSNQFKFKENRFIAYNAKR